MLFQRYHFVFTPQKVIIYWTVILSSSVIWGNQNCNNLTPWLKKIFWSIGESFFLTLSEWCCFWAKHTKYFWTIDPLFSHIAPHLRGAMTSIDIWGDHYCNVHVCACFVSCVFFWPLVSIFHCYIIFYKADNWKSIPSLHYKSM